MESTINLNFVQLFHFIAILFTGLVAGLFYGYDCSVIKGLGNLKNEAYLQSFQSINKAIQNPYFFVSFMGCLLVLPFASWLCFKSSNPFSFYFMLSATIVYFIGVLGVTILGNAPLNEQLAKFTIASATENEIALMRKIFEKSWNSYHTIRTVASIAAFTLTILSLIRQKQ
jgi:uncharacterized membrane protein